jgi:hypothetical protein
VRVFVADSFAGAGGAVLGAVTAVDVPAAAVARSANPLDVDVEQFAGSVALAAADQLAGGPAGQAGIAFGPPAMCSR